MTGLYRNERVVELKLHRSVHPNQVRVNGEDHAGWSFDASQQMMNIRLSCLVDQETILFVWE